MAKNFRLFYLTNSNNETLSFNECDLFAYSPTGLGLSFSNDYIEYNANFIPVQQIVNQSSLNVMMLYSAILKQSYISYNNFVNFLNYQPYTLEYDIPPGKFKRICQLNEISKSELELSGVLNESLVLDYLTPWFTEITHSVNGDGDEQIEGTGKIYLQNGTNPGAYIYDYIYCWGDNSNSNGDIFVNVANSSKTFNIDVSSPIKIKITAADGSVVNPSWDLYVNGQLVQSDGFNVTIEPGHSLEVSSFPEDQYAVLIDQNGNRSPIYQTQDLTKTNFVEIPEGNSTLIFNAPNGQISWIIREQYLVV